MRGAYYVATALLIAACSRTAAESDQALPFQPSDRVNIASSDMGPATVPDKLLRRSHDVPNEFTRLADTEERVNLAGTRDFLNELEKPLLRVPVESVKENPAGMKAEAKTWHLFAPSDSIASIDDISRIRENSGTGVSALAPLDEIAQKRHRFSHPELDETFRKKQRLAHPSSSTAINTPSHTRPSNEQADPLSDHWGHRSSNMRGNPQIAEQISNSQQNKVISTHTPHTAYYESSFNSIEKDISRQNGNPSQILLSDDLTKLHQSFISFQDLPCTQTPTETESMLLFYNQNGGHFPSAEKIIKWYKLVTNDMTTGDLESMLSQDAMTLHELKDWTIFEGYRKRLQQAEDYRLMLQKPDEYRMMLLQREKDYNVKLRQLIKDCRIMREKAKVYRKMREKAEDNQLIRQKAEDFRLMKQDIMITQRTLKKAQNNRSVLSDEALAKDTNYRKKLRIAYHKKLNTMFTLFYSFRIHSIAKSQ